MVNANLASLGENEECKILEIDRCGHAQKRLYELGLYKSAKVKVLKNDVGPIIISISGCKLALGRNLAKHIQITK